MTRKCFRLLMLLALILLGCSHGFKKYQRPELPFTFPEKFQQQADSGAVLASEDKWWRAFGDRNLDALVERVMAHNLDIRSAVARVLEVQARLRRAGADRWPQVDFDARFQRQRLSTIDPIYGHKVARTTDSYSLSLPASYEVDLWGRLSGLEEAARARVLQQQESLHVVTQTVVAEAVSRYVRLWSLVRRRDYLQRTVNTLADSLEVVERRYSRGLSSSLDVRQARRALAQAEAALPAVDDELVRVRIQLAVLAGCHPELEDFTAPEVLAFDRLTPVPPGLPSSLLLRRPDIKSAEARLAALHAEVAAAYASRFPQLKLTGDLGFASHQLSELLSPASRFWSLAAGLVQPLVDGGRLEANQMIAEARYKQAVADYAKTVLNAMAEVEFSLASRRNLTERRKRVALLVREAKATLETARKRYQRGLMDYLAVLEAQKTLVSAQLDLVEADQALYQNRIDLYRALGGGWGRVEPEAFASEKDNTNHSRMTR